MDDFILNISDSSDENDTQDRNEESKPVSKKSTTGSNSMDDGNTGHSSRATGTRKSVDADKNSENHEATNGTKKGRAKRGLRNRLFDENSKFLADFDPGQSQREKRKMERSIRVVTKPIGLYDLKGMLRSNGEDLCDCLEQRCPGCHMPCSDCGNGKCGKVCRKYRKWMYDRIEMDAKNGVRHNPFKN
ncbi:ARL14 effector protein-like [Anopheles moucheti]|uniref:ARL14 effector protein-like n=1 Tax=Anopheles moucheti TaxID=186751 RepID=UPI0022F06D7F|nr:ARL14 effector protein-like [Anopheles moucheti]